ncbi:recombinase family protein [Blastococcus sp. SYSU D01042]
MPGSTSRSERPTVTRAVLYLRLSESDEASTSIARQEADLRARAAREGWTVVDVLVDDGVSGGKRRPKADQALSMLRDGAAEVLAVWKMDRWTRQGLSALADLLEVLEQRPEATFVADRDGLDSTAATWDLHAGMLVAVAKMERDNTKARVKSSVDRLRRVGRYAGGNLPYGYRSTPNPEGPGRVLVINEAEAAVVREAASRVLAGESIYAISRDLNAREIPTRRPFKDKEKTKPRTWSIQALRQVLTADAILGRITHRGELLRGEDGLPFTVWPPVLDLETWTRVRSALGVGIPRGVRPPRRRRSGLLSGLVTCAGCGAPLYLRSNGAGHAAYGCSARSNGRPCDGVSISADAVERHVAEVFLSGVGDREVIEEVIEAGPDAAALAEVQRAIEETAREMTADDADPVELGRRLALLKERRAALKAAPQEPTVRLVPTGRTYSEAWEAADLDGRRAILGATLAVLSVRKGRRGSRIFDPARVVMMSSPAHVAGVSTDPKDRWAVVADAA